MTPARAIAATLAMLGLCLPFAPPAAARPPQAGVETGARAECRTIASRVLGRAVPYCALLPPGYAADASRRYPVLYLLHGLGDNEQTFLRAGGFHMVEDLWEGRRIGEYIIVMPDGGTSFYINSQDGSVRYEDFFLEEFLPEIESRYRVRRSRESRGLAGISMGGYGALRLAFRHPQLFGSVSAHSAALAEEVPDIRLGATASSMRLQVFTEVFGSPVDRAFWNRNNPLTLARTRRIENLKIYFDCGTEDRYGFYVGARALHDALAARRIPHEFHLYPGGHDPFYFAEHLPASFEFHSRAFGLAAAPARGGR